MPPSKQGKKRRPPRSSSSSPRDNDPNQPTSTTVPASSVNPRRHTRRSRQLTLPELAIVHALNASRVKDPSPYRGSFTEEIKALQTVFPSTFEAYHRQYTAFKDREDIFKYIKTQDKKTYPKIITPLYQEGLSDENRYVAIDETIRTLFEYRHRLQFPTPRPPNISNNERYYYSAVLSNELSSIFLGLDFVVPDQEPNVQE